MAQDPIFGWQNRPSFDFDLPDFIENTFKRRRKRYRHKIRFDIVLCALPLKFRSQFGQSL